MKKYKILNGQVYTRVIQTFKSGEILHSNYRKRIKKENHHEKTNNNPLLNAFDIEPAGPRASKTKMQRGNNQRAALSISSFKGD